MQTSALRRHSQLHLANPSPGTRPSELCLTKGPQLGCGRNIGLHALLEGWQSAFGLLYQGSALVLVARA
jgi:hypothetical protein